MVTRTITIDVLETISGNVTRVSLIVGANLGADVLSLKAITQRMFDADIASLATGPKQLVTVESSVSGSIKGQSAYKIILVSDVTA